MKPETQQWLAKADEHLGAASALLQLGHYAQCIFFCQQSLEMLLKAIWIERAPEGLPRRTHDLVSLAKELELGLSEERLKFLRLLSEQYIPTRYGDIPIEYSQETADNYLGRTKELFSWLRPMLS